MSETDNRPITRDKSTTTTTATKEKTPTKRGTGHFALVEEVIQEDGSRIFKELPLPDGLLLDTGDDGKTAKIHKALVRVSNAGDTTYQGKKMHVVYYTGEGIFIELDPTPRYRLK